MLDEENCLDIYIRMSRRVFACLILSIAFARNIVSIFTQQGVKNVWLTTVVIMISVLVNNYSLLCVRRNVTLVLCSYLRKQSLFNVNIDTVEYVFVTVTVNHTPNGQII